MVVAGARLADANSSGWQMPGVSADALHQPMTDVRAPFGRQHFITLHCSPSSPQWTHQPAWQTHAQPHCTSPIPSFATPFHPHIHAHISASISQALLLQTAVILATNGSHANAARRIHSGNLKYQSLEFLHERLVCVCLLMGEEERFYKVLLSL